MTKTVRSIIGALATVFTTALASAQTSGDTSSRLPLEPAVTNFNQVKNHTDNRHGIDGYLDDMTVARWILNALV